MNLESRLVQNFVNLLCNMKKLLLTIFLCSIVGAACAGGLVDGVSPPFWEMSPCLIVCTIINVVLFFLFAIARPLDDIGNVLGYYIGL